MFEMTLMLMSFISIGVAAAAFLMLFRATPMISVEDL